MRSAAWSTLAPVEYRTEECEGCNNVKPIPMIEIEEGSPPISGICEDVCVPNYGMQVGQMLRLRKPGHDGETDVMFAAPTENGIRVRYLHGLIDTIGWHDFDKID
jgi:hypothetical protein